MFMSCSLGQSVLDPVAGKSHVAGDFAAAEDLMCQALSLGKS